MSQSLSKIWTHLIFSTKDRYPFLSEKTVREQLHAYMASTLRNQECPTLLRGGTADHVHSLYILKQEQHHRKVTFQDELREFFKRYEVEYDERYVWG